MIFDWIDVNLFFQYNGNSFSIQGIPDDVQWVPKYAGSKLCYNFLFKWQQIDAFLQHMKNTCWWNWLGIFWPANGCWYKLSFSILNRKKTDLQPVSRPVEQNFGFIERCPKKGAKNGANVKRNILVFYHYFMEFSISVIHNFLLNKCFPNFRAGWF